MAARLIYLHGFASGPRSRKAQSLKRQCAAVGQRLEVPDLNQGGFSGLTLTRQIDQVSGMVTASGQPAILIGSSFGGLTAAWVAERCPQVARLVLLAPAFGFRSHLQAYLGEAQWERWRREAALPVYHHGFGHEVMLSYGFALDLGQYPEQALKRPVPTDIIHGDRDTVIPVSASQRYQQRRSWVTLMRVNDDHSLTHSLGCIWQQIQASCQLSSP